MCNCNNGCNECGSCNTCKTTTLSQFAEIKTLASQSMFILASGKKVSLETLINVLGMTVENPDIANFPDGTIPMVLAGQLVPSSLVEGIASIKSALDIILPGDSIRLEDVLALHNVGAFAGLESANGEAYIQQYAVDNAQSYKPKWLNLAGETLELIQAVDAVNQSAQSITFELPLAGSNQAWKINQMSLKGVSAVSGVRMRISKDSAPLIDNSNIIFQWPVREKWIAGEGYDFQAGDFTIDTKPLTLDTNGTYYVTFEVTVGSGDAVSLKGDGVTPFLRVLAQIGDIEDVATESDIKSYSGQGYIVDSALTNTFGGGTGPAGAEIVNFGADFIPDIEDGITISTSGRFTNNGPSRRFCLSADLYGQIGGAVSREYIFYIAKNGVVINSSGSKIAYDGVNAASNSCSSIINLDTDEYVELWVEAVTATTALNVDSASIKMFSI